VDREIFESRKKKLRIQKYPHTCGRGLKDLYIFITERPSQKGKPKLIVPICFGTKPYKFCLRIFDLEDSEINYDRARSTTANSLLRAWRAVYIISSDERGDEPL